MNDTSSKRELPKPTPTPARRRRLRTCAWLMGGLLLIVWAAPWVIANSPLRNVLLQQLAAKDDWRVQAAGASFGWVTPLTLSQVTAEHRVLPVTVRIESVRCDRTWWASWLNLPAIGRVELQGPEIDLVISQQVPNLPPRRTGRTTGEFVAHNAAFRLFREGDAEPLLDLRDMHITAAIESQEQGRVLKVRPVRLLDNAELTPDLCDAGLQLIAPILAPSTAVSGRASLELQELQVPLDGADPKSMLAGSTVEGTLKLEHVTTNLKDTVVRDLATVAAQLLRVKLPTAVRVTEGTEIAFALRDGRIYHDGLTFILPELSPDMEWHTRGSVGLDKSLDLAVQTHIPFSLAGQSPLLRRLTDNPLEFRIVGTMDKPKLELPPGQPWLQQALEATLAERLPEDAQPLAAAALEWLQQLRAGATEGEGADEPTVAERLREKLQELREKRGNGRGGLFGKKRRNQDETDSPPDQKTTPPGEINL